jgi:hypothetical protein
MSLLVVSALVLGYVVFVVIVLALLAAAKRTDEAIERDREALLRSKRARASYPSPREPDEGTRERPVRSRAGLRR